GIPGIEKAGENVTSLIRVHGLKSGVRHAVRVSCGAGEATLYLDTGSSVKDVSARDGEVVNLTVKNCGIQPTPSEIDYNGKMRLVAAGAFLMGDDQGQPNEKPAREVNLNYDYYIDKFEVTNQQYRVFCNTTGRVFPSEPHWDTSYSANFPNSPVLGVTWDDAKAYCDEWGKGLPTEEEWEKAASWDPSATDASKRWKRRWPWGNEFGQGRANFASEHSTPVGQYDGGVSAYGVYEMAGNAAEWIADHYNPYPGNQVSDPQFGTANRLVRGGHFRSLGADNVRTTFRQYRPPAYSTQELSAMRAWLIGFRCAIKIDNPRLREQLKKVSRIN
ncbi:MAG: formylglycine-generating enzyme family protein, partial [Acidobacteria bacterium]|nr:formylglycine-generating enzyme family protein [Acidobacteriota bacterium]